MTGLIASLVLGQQLTFGKHHSRAEFYQALATIDHEMTKQEVEDRLGKPDDIWPADDAVRYSGNVSAEYWCYGTSGHHTFPTLATIRFASDDMRTGYHGPARVPPDPSLISERELRDSMTKIHRFEYISQLQFGRYGDDNDPLRLIQAANVLQPLGTEKAIAVLAEYAHLSSGTSDHDFLFWLARILFVGKNQGYFFPLPHNGLTLPSEGFDLKEWPTYPVREVDGFSITVPHWQMMMAGKSESFESYLRKNRSDWMVRSSNIVPPDDPFPLWKKWRESTPSDDRSDSRNGKIALEILRGVRNAYTTDTLPPLSFGRQISEEAVEKMHQGFLRVGGHWDPQREIYIRKDGSFTADDIRDYPQHHYTFEGLDGFEASLTMIRETKDFVHVFLHFQDHEGAKVPSALLVTRRTFNGKKLTEKDQPSSGQNNDSLVLPEHIGKSGSMGTGVGFFLPYKGTAQIVIWIGKQEFKSPAFEI